MISVLSCGGISTSGFSQVYQAARFSPSPSTAVAGGWSASSPCTIGGATVPTGKAGCFFNPAGFAVPSGSFGTFGKDVLHAEHLVNTDASLVKRFPLGEGRYFQLRFEAFNVFNFQVLAIPAGTTIGLANAGLVQNIASVSRQLQFGAKFAF